MTIDELKPCPFCGGEAINDAIGDDDVGRRYRQCLCNTCGAESAKVIFGVYPLELTDAEAKAKARNAWNTRADTARASGDVVERVARAIYATEPAKKGAEDGSRTFVPVAWEEAAQHGFGKVADCLKYAKAALAAMPQGVPDSLMAALSVLRDVHLGDNSGREFCVRMGAMPDHFDNRERYVNAWRVVHELFCPPTPTPNCRAHAGTGITAPLLNSGSGLTPMPDAATIKRVNEALHNDRVSAARELLRNDSGEYVERTSGTNPTEGEK